MKTKIGKNWYNILYSLVGMIYWEVLNEISYQKWLLGEI